MKNKKYKVINLWPNNKHFRVGDILTKHPSGDKIENRYGVRHNNHWEWVISPELYIGNFVEIL